MKNKELIEKLLLLPMDADVLHLWDGALRTEINHVYLGKEGHIVTADFNEVSYYDSGRPLDAPTKKEAEWWETPPNPLDDEDLD